MKIINLLNKIVNGEIKLGTKFNWHYKLYDIELIFTERQGALGLYFQSEDRLIGLFEKFNYQILNDEVEILEEEKEIPEKLDDFTIAVGSVDESNIEEYIQTLFNQEYEIFNKINSIIDYLKSKGE